MTHTALLIHSLTQAHARPREDRQRGKAQAERANERATNRQREQYTTQHNDRYIVNTLTMQYSSMVWWGVGQGCAMGSRRGGEQTNNKKCGHASHRSGTPGTALNNLMQVFYFSFGINIVNGPSRPRITPHTIAKQYSGADARQHASRNAQLSRRASKIVKNLTM